MPWGSASRSAEHSPIGYGRSSPVSAEHVRKTPEWPCKPSSVPRSFPRGGEHSSRALVAQDLVSEQPGKRSTWATPSPAVRRGMLPLLALAPGGVCRAVQVTLAAVRSYRTVSPLPREPEGARGGLFSVALSCGSRRLVVNQHPARWSSDFPPVAPSCSDRRSPGPLRQGVHTASSVHAPARPGGERPASFHPRRRRLRERSIHPRSRARLAGARRGLACRAWGEGSAPKCFPWPRWEAFGVT